MRQCRRDHNQPKAWTVGLAASSINGVSWMEESASSEQILTISETATAPLVKSSTLIGCGVHKAIWRVEGATGAAAGMRSKNITRRSSRLSPSTQWTYRRRDTLSTHIMSFDTQTNRAPHAQTLD